MIEYRTKEAKRKFYDSREWKQLREEVKRRDNYECQECKRNGLVKIDTNEYSEKARRKKIQLVVHHKQELEEHPELALEIDNLETLCVECHNREHGRTFERNVNKWEHDERWD